MKILLMLLIMPALLPGQINQAYEAYKVWDQQHPRYDQKGRSDSLLQISAEWIAKWPDSKVAWDQRREALISTHNPSPDFWKQVGENLIRLNPPHTYVNIVAEDWVSANVNLKDAEGLIISETKFLDAKPVPARPSMPTLADLVDEAERARAPFSRLCTLASAQIQLKEFDSARATIERVRSLLDTSFKQYYDQYPLETFPDYESKYFTLAARLTQAEERYADAMALYQLVVTNPYYRREYGNRPLSAARSLWTKMGGTDAGWTIFSRVSALPLTSPPAGPASPFYPGSPWYKLPEMHSPGLGSKMWTTADFQGKTTMVYVWASWCAPCWMHLPGIQTLYTKIRDRKDIQIVTLSVDDDMETVRAFMSDDEAADQPGAIGSGRYQYRYQPAIHQGGPGRPRLESNAKPREINLPFAATQG